MPKSIADKFRDSARRSYRARTRSQPQPTENTSNWKIADEVSELFEQLVRASEGQIEITQSSNSAVQNCWRLDIAKVAAFDIRLARNSASIRPGPSFDDPTAFIAYLQDDFVRLAAKTVAKQAAEAGRPLFPGPSIDEETGEPVRWTVGELTEEDGKKKGRYWAARATVRQLKSLLGHFEDSTVDDSHSAWEICDLVQAGDQESEPTWFDDKGEPWPRDVDPELLQDAGSFFGLENDALYRFWDVVNEAELDALPARYRIGFVKGALKVAKKIRKDAKRT